MKNTIVTISAVLLVAIPSAASAFTCTGAASHLAIHRTGDVYVNIGSGVWKICNLTQTIGAVPKESCESWYATLLSARLADRAVTLHFDATEPGNNGVTTCAELGSWVHRSPYYVEAG